MLQLFATVFSYAAYTSLGYTVYSYYSHQKLDLSKLAYAVDQIEFHKRMVAYYQKIIDSKGCCKK